MTGCFRRDKAQIPIEEEGMSDSTLTLIWTGRGRAFRMGSGGAWSRDSTYDYTFTVVQRRDGARWRSVKTLQRRHPEYDGRAGERAQTMFFALDFHEEKGSLVSRLQSSLGSGAGKSDREFREQAFEVAATGISPYAPYSHYRIVQHYRYEQGLLEETVDLLKRKDEKETPFMRVEERALIFTHNRLAEAPSRL